MDQWVEELALSVARVQSLAMEFLHAVGATRKKKKKRQAQKHEMLTAIVFNGWEYR